MGITKTLAIIAAGMIVTAAAGGIFAITPGYAAQDDPVKEMYCANSYSEETGELTGTGCSWTEKQCEEWAELQNESPEHVVNPDDCAKTDTQCPDFPCATKENRKEARKISKD